MSIKVYNKRFLAFGAVRVSIILVLLGICAGFGWGIERECVYHQIDWFLYIEMNSYVWGGPHTSGYMCRSRG